MPADQFQWPAAGNFAEDILQPRSHRTDGAALRQVEVDAAGCIGDLLHQIRVSEDAQADREDLDIVGFRGVGLAQHIGDGGSRIRHVGLSVSEDHHETRRACPSMRVDLITGQFHSRRNVSAGYVMAGLSMPSCRLDLSQIAA